MFEINWVKMVFKPTSIKNLKYYDYNIHNLMIHKYFLKLHKVEFSFKSKFHLHVAHFVKLDILCK
jgi:hypothetical protein